MTYTLRLLDCLFLLPRARAILPCRLQALARSASFRGRSMLTPGASRQSQTSLRSLLWRLLILEPSRTSFLASVPSIWSLVCSWRAFMGALANFNLDGHSPLPIRHSPHKNEAIRQFAIHATPKTQPIRQFAIHLTKKYRPFVNSLFTGPSKVSPKAIRECHSVNERC